MSSSNVTLTPKDHANLTLLKVNTYGTLTVGFGVATYFIIRVYDNFLRGTVITQNWLIITIICASALVYSMVVGFFAFWVKAYTDAFIIWGYGQFLYDRRKKERQKKDD